MILTLVTLLGCHKRVETPEPPPKKEPTPAASLSGKAAAIIDVAAGRMPNVDISPLFLDLYTSQPPVPCALHIGRGAAEPGFNFSLGENPKAGDIIKHHSTENYQRAVPPTYARVTVRSQDLDHITTYANGDAFVIIDKLGRDRVRGRIYAAFRDPGKSLLVGSFDAAICPDADVQ